MAKTDDPVPSQPEDKPEEYPPGKTYSGGFYTGDAPDGWWGRAVRGPNRGRGPRGYQRSDERIEDEIVRGLINNDEIDAGNIELHVNAGEVVLEGSVPERWMKQAIEDLAAGCLGVRDVASRIQVSTG